MKQKILTMSEKELARYNIIKECLEKNTQNESSRYAEYQCASC